MNAPSSKVLCPDILAVPSSRTIGAALDQIAYGILCALVFALPWEIDTGPRFIPWLGYGVFGVTFLRTVVLGQARRLREPHYLMLSLAVWSGTSLIWTVDLDSTADRVVTYAQLLVLAWVIWVLADNEARVLKLLQFYVFGTYVTAVATVSNAIAGHAFGQINGVEGPPGARYIISGMNPNSVAFLLVPSIPMTLYLLVKKKCGPVTTLLYWLQLVLCVTAIFLSGSRGSLLAMAPIIPMALFIVVRLPWWQRILALLAVAGTAVCGVFVVPSETWHRLFQLGAEVSSGTMTHRTDIWKASWEVFRDHAFVGVGANAHMTAVEKIIDMPLVAHNTFLSVLVELGIVGELLLLGLLVALFYCVLHMPRLERALWIAALVVWCIAGASTTIEYEKGTWFLLSLLTAHAYARRGITHAG